jgi:uncharacterized protein (DUF433 family)
MGGVVTFIDTLIAQPPPPILLDADGVARVGGTRVTLDSVLFAFNSGHAAEEILLKYPTLDLTDIYAVIAYYLRNRSEVDAYLESRRRQTQETVRELDARFPPGGVRERLLARRGARP